PLRRGAGDDGLVTVLLFFRVQHIFRGLAGRNPALWGRLRGAIARRVLAQPLPRRSGLVTGRWVLGRCHHSIPHPASPGCSAGAPVSSPPLPSPLPTSEGSSALRATASNVVPSPRFISP